MKRPRDLRYSRSLGNSGTSGSDVVVCGGGDDGQSIWPSDFPVEGVGVDGPNGSALVMRRVLPADEARGSEYLGTASVEDEGTADGVISGAGGSMPSSE
jgi:hypothetical protein